MGLYMGLIGDSAPVSEIGRCVLRDTSDDKLVDDSIGTDQRNNSCQHLRHNLRIGDRNEFCFAIFPRQRLN